MYKLKASLGKSFTRGMNGGWIACAAVVSHIMCFKFINIKSREKNALAWHVRYARVRWNFYHSCETCMLERTSLPLVIPFYMFLSINSDRLFTRLYDKRDRFDFHADNCPFLDSNIPTRICSSMYTVLGFLCPPLNWLKHSCPWLIWASLNIEIILEEIPDREVWQTTVNIPEMLPYILPTVNWQAPWGRNRLWLWLICS
jgi:hypothetical protein